MKSHKTISEFETEYRSLIEIVNNPELADARKTEVEQAKDLTDKLLPAIFGEWKTEVREEVDRQQQRVSCSQPREPIKGYPQSMAEAVNRAKTVLEADSRFFEGVHAPRRHSQGRVLEPSSPSSPEDFIHSAFVPKEDAVVMVSEAYQKFLGYCQMENLTRVEFTEFKRVARDLVLEKFQLGLRHDIRTPEGRQTHGWKHLCLVPDLPEKACDAA
jgi:hypothetical protein